MTTVEDRAAQAAVHAGHERERAAHNAAIAEHHADRADNAARFADGAAHRADARSRDADRIIRWGVALILAAVLAIFLRGEQNSGAVRADMAELRAVLSAELADVRAVLERLTDGPETAP